MKLGPHVDFRACGFSSAASHLVCGDPVAVHGVIWAEETALAACVRHAESLAIITDEQHSVDLPACFGEGSWWLTRPDGSSFCYFPETEADLQVELAAGVTAHLVH